MLTSGLTMVTAIHADSAASATFSDWPMFRHDLAHTGYTPEVVNPPLELKWKYKAGDYVFSSPAVANGIVYVGSDDNYVYALDANSGSLKWKYQTGADVTSSPAVANGIVYVGSCDYHVYALDANTGSLKWKYKTGAEVYLSSPAVANGIVYVGSKDNYVYALDANTGSLKWEYKTGYWVRSSPAVANGIVYVGSWDTYVYALDANTGSLKWEYKTGSSVDSSPAVASGIVYVGSRDDYVYALDANTGSPKWKYLTGCDVASSPAVANGMVYVGLYVGLQGSCDNNVYAFAPLTPVEPSVSIETDKFKYWPDDTMTITIDISNPTDSPVTFNWYLGVPQFEYWTQYYEGTVPAGYEDTIEVPLPVGNWGSTSFVIVWYVDLQVPETGEILAADETLCLYWPYWAQISETVAMPAVSMPTQLPMDIAAEIGEEIEGIA